MRSLHEDARSVARQVEACHVRCEHLRGSGAIGGRPEERAAARPARAPGLPEELAAARRELVAIDPFVDLARAGRRGQIGEPQLDLEVSFERPLRDEQDAVAADGEGLHALAQRPLSA
jgi:hypothetical protein